MATRNFSNAETIVGFLPYSNLMVMSVGIGLNWLIRSMQSMVDENIDLEDHTYLGYMSLSMFVLMSLFFMI